MKKFLLRELPALLLVLSVLGLFIYAVLPEVEELKGKCFFFPSQAMSRNFLNGKFSFIKILSNNSFQYRAAVKYLDFDLESRKISKIMDKKETNIHHEFRLQGYRLFDCPNEGDVLEVMIGGRDDSK